MWLNRRSIFLILFICGISFCQTLYAGEAIRVDRENGLLENLQVVLLFFSSVVFLIPVSGAERRYRCILFAGAMLCFSFMLRELDVEDLAVPQWMITMGSGTGRDILLGSGWVIVGVLTAQSRAILKDTIKPILFSRATMLFFVSGLVLLSGSVFDHKENKVPADQLAEEIIEVVGYCILFSAAILSRFMIRSLSEASRESPNA